MSAELLLPFFVLLSPAWLLLQWPGRRWKVAAWIGGIMTTGVGIPLFAVWWQQSKLSG